MKVVEYNHMYRGDVSVSDTPTRVYRTHLQHEVSVLDTKVTSTNLIQDRSI